MNEWWQAIITLAVGFALGVIATLLFRRSVSGRTGERADSVEQCIGELGELIDGAEAGVDESVKVCDELADESGGVAESVGRLTEGADSIEGAVRDARASVERLKELVRRERERTHEAEAEEQHADSRD